VPAPVNVAGADSTPLSVGDTGTAPQPTRVRFAASSPVTVGGNPQSINTNSVAELRFDLGFTTNTGPTRRDFRIRLDTQDTAATMQLFFIAFEDADAAVDPTGATPTRVQSRAFPLNDGQNRSVTVMIGAGSTSPNTTLRLTATVEAVDDGTVADTRSFTVRQS